MEDLQAGDPEQIGPYRVIARLGRGAQGVVYLGDRDGDLAAVKLLHARFGGNHRLRARFAQELAAAQRVDDPCVARLLGAGIERGAPWVASEFVHGLSLSDVVEGAGPRTGPPLDRLAIGVAGALWAMHRAGVIHRDLRPGNVLLDSGGPRVIDFGYGSALEGGGVRGVLGGPSFRAPEQVSGRETDSAADVWAWACLMVYAATGRPPFGEGSIQDVVTRVLTEPPSLGGLDGRLGQLVEDSLAKEPRRRPSAQQLLLELTGTTAPSARSWPSLSVVRTPEKPPRPHIEPVQPYLGGLAGAPMTPLRPLLLAASVVVPLVVGGAVVKWNDSRSEPVVAQVAAASQDRKLDLGGAYRVKALGGGTDDGRAFADYEITNTSGQAVALETPGALLIRKEALPEEVRAGCEPVLAMCALRTGTVVRSAVAGSPPPKLRDGTLTMPPRAVYVLRISTTDRVEAELAQADLGLYVLDPRFTQRAIALPFAE
ncbi:serine/threonine-protein kinase [Actinocorallia sp. A-T 12471]|uniref:serine/threonine protein kinase n=1 Tax=Actinocorallia sp. A-T 12471 TaxID=3089813 RepID=UPI0029D3B1C1|nr:serine/threonine-protein kinase [Actinocorallia sp. A-T 12471]MDX6744972.1 serine/threonine-protein kinase [Actinocorallia sp. A-T 12471]